MEDYKRICAIINLDSIKSNLLEIRNKIGNDTKMICVVKADAYGHGALEVAKEMVDFGAYMLAVSNDLEAIELRENGIKLPILILGYTPINRIDKIIDYNITQTVYDLDFAKMLDEKSRLKGKTTEIHIKLDTGMGRIGFLCNKEGISKILELKDLKNLAIKGIFTHYSKADEKLRAYTENQISTFIDTIEILKKNGINPPLIHSSNSAGIMEYPKGYFNCVRPGIIQYGLYPSSEILKESLRLIPAMSIKSTISNVKKVPLGTKISYGGTYTTDSEKIIGTVPVGYADGYLRSMQNGGRVIVNGFYAPIVGRVCMDQFMIDLTNIPNTKIGDTVTLLGKEGELEITADEIAEIMDTISYEVVCLVSRRVPRLYIKNNKEYKSVSYLS